MQRESADYFGKNNRYVKELTPSNFNSTAPWQLKNNSDNVVLILFYAPWCGHCKAVKDEWEKAGKMSGFCDFAAFNCEKNNAHVQKIKEDMPELIPSYPSIVIYTNGSPSEYYNGERTSQAFIAKCMSICKKSGKCKKKFSKPLV